MNNEKEWSPKNNHLRVAMNEKNIGYNAKLGFVEVDDAVSQRNDDPNYENMKNQDKNVYSTIPSVQGSTHYEVPSNKVVKTAGSKYENVEEDLKK